MVVLVDGAHAPGMLDVDVSSLGGAFYTGNCHKWMCSPKGAAFLWVPEPYRATAVAASISHGHNDGWPASGSRFHAQFDWTGTDDPTPRLCVADAITVLGNHHPDGWPGIRADNRALARAGRDLLLDALDIAAPAPESMLGSMAAVPVPPDTDGSSSIFDPLTTALHTDWAIEVPVFSWPAPPERLLRISAQQYNAIADFRSLAEALNCSFGAVVADVGLPEASN